MSKKSEGVRLYWTTLLGFFIEIDSLNTTHEKCEYWLNEYHHWLSIHRIVIGSDLLESDVLSHVLLHPDFMYDKEGNSFRSSLDRVQMTVLDGERTGSCMLSNLSGDDCVFNEFPQFRGELEGDHIWPYSLGGPTNTRDNLILNRVLLCKHCNRSKSNSISDYHWDNAWWMEKRLSLIARRKSR